MKRKILVFLILFLAVLFAFSATAFADYYTGWNTLRYGMSGTEVKNLQNDLKALNVFGANPTGYFGSLTKQAVVKYQAVKGLTQDGIVGHKTARAIKTDCVIKTAKSLQGVPYVWGGSTPSGFDCSGFTQYVMTHNRITIQRTAALQYQQGTWVDKSKLIPGDFVFFSTYAAGASHVGIYIGGGQFIHASSGAGKVIISLLSNTYYTQHYLGAKRMLP